MASVFFLQLNYYSYLLPLLSNTDEKLIRLSFEEDPIISLLVSVLLLWAQSTTRDYIRAEHKLHSIDYIRAEHKLHSISKFFISQVIIPQVMFFGLLFFFFLAYLYSAGTQHGNLHSAGRPILFCGPTQEPCVSHSQHRRYRKRFWKNAGEWTVRVKVSKEEILGSKRTMYSYILTYSRLERENV